MVVKPNHTRKHGINLFSNIFSRLITAYSKPTENVNFNKAHVIILPKSTSNPRTCHHMWWARNLFASKTGSSAYFPQ